ncbi:MAG: Smr/MutS family protein [Holosporaceae bacterium]|jgi:DNA-nicking Smr family endonuclease|nr:Smr/MutS family protein [Holosporaceae bacterium]
MSRKYRRNFAVERSIDLHGMTTEEAFAQLSDFLARCQFEGVKNALIITGGNSMKTSVLRASLMKWAKESFGEYIASFAQAQLHHGGEGAFYVILKRII